MRYSSPIPALSFIVVFQTFISPFGTFSRLAITGARATVGSQRRLSFASCLKLKHLRGMLQLWSTKKKPNVARVKARKTRASHSGLVHGIASCCSGIIMLLIMYILSTWVYQEPTRPLGWAACAVLWWGFGMGMGGNTDGSNVIDIKIHFITFKYLNFIPGRLISRYWGNAVSSFKIPRIVRPYVYAMYTYVFNVKLHECEVSDFQHYEYISNFFLRSLRRECRPLDGEALLVSPCDGKILCLDKIKDDMVRHVKGITYDLRCFLGPTPGSHENDPCAMYPDECHGQYWPQMLSDPMNNELFHCVIYLAPGDYHKFHSPADWKMTHRRHFPGDLLSVHPLVARFVPNLYVLNERVVLFGSWKHGFFSMTAVGATNVGSIKIYRDEVLVTNRGDYVHGEYRNKSYEFDSNIGPIELRKGDGVGEFNLGSTIVLVFEAPRNFKFESGLHDIVQFGKII